VTAHIDLDAALTATEQRLAALHDALCLRDAQAIELQADALQRTLAQALASFSHAARAGSVPPELRHRLAQASARVASQRESLLRAQAALDRALGTLLPPPQAGGALYSPAGAADGRPSGGVLLA
jgi:hypothetical protein